MSSIPNMRRSDRAVFDRSRIDAIIRDANICRIGLVDNDQAYIVPMSFGYDGTALYFHSAVKGHKVDLMTINPDVSFEIDILDRIVKTEKGCGWTMEYRSVIGNGTIEFLETDEEKRYGLSVLMSQYSDKTFEFPDKDLRKTLVFKLVIDQITAKQSPENKQPDSPLRLSG